MALGLCNALRDGVDLLRQWRHHLAVAAFAPSRADPGALLGEGQICRTCKVVTDVTMLMLDDKDTGSVGGQRNGGTERQEGAIGGNLPVPRAHDLASTGSLASAVYTMGAVLFVTSWALVAAIPSAMTVEELVLAANGGGKGACRRAERDEDDPLLP
ncbi:hypothetical protein ACQ4PT_000832 [Festuca glaucescens]